MLLERSATVHDNDNDDHGNGHDGAEGPVMVALLSMVS